MLRNRQLNHITTVSKNTQLAPAIKNIHRAVTNLVTFLYICREVWQIMRVVAKKILREFWVKHNDSEEPLKTWYKEASKATWTSPSDIKAEYAKASILKNSRVVFNICGNKYRLIIKINYKRQWVFIRYIGTHYDYDNIDANKI